jgi:hypothetical protein
VEKDGEVENRREMKYVKILEHWKMWIILKTEETIGKLKFRVHEIWRV